MLATEPQSATRGNGGGWLSRLVRHFLRIARVTRQFLLALWATLAAYYSNLPWSWLRLFFAVAFSAFSVRALWLTRRPLNIVRYARSAGFDLRHCVNGGVDRYLYAEGLLNTTLPFNELRARSRIQETTAPAFSRRIRRGLPVDPTGPNVSSG